MGQIRSNVRRLFRLRPRSDRAVDEDADAELQAFLDARIEHLVARGMSRGEAQVEAESRLGGSIESARDALHRSARRRSERLLLEEALADGRADIRYAARALRRDPFVTAFIIVTLALGIGANAAMFGVVDRLLLEGPAHVREHDRVMRLYSTTSGRTGPETTAIFGYVTYGLLATNARSLAGVAAYQVNDGTVGRGADARPIVMGRATASFFSLLGVRPALGRFFTADEDSPSGATRLAVLGYDFWQRTFDGEPNAIGATVVLDEESYVVIGVAPRGFTGVSLSAVDAWTPASLRGARMGVDWATAWYWTSLRVIARLKSDVTAAQASDEATAVHANGHRLGAVAS